MNHKPHMTVEDLVLFYHVVDKGGFLRAAETLNLNQGKATRSVARLEEAFGAKLLYRDMRHVSLTKPGKIVFEMARDILERMNQGHMDVQSEYQDMVGSITLSVAAGFGNYWLMPHLMPFLKRHPQIKMNLKTNDHEVNLMMGKTDIAILTSKPDFREALECHLLCEYPLHIYASEAYLAAYGTPQRVEDLDHHQLIGWQEDTHASLPTDLFNTLLYVGRNTHTPRDASIYVESDLTMITAIGQHSGLGFMAQFFGESFPAFRRVFLENEDALFKGCVNRKYIVYHQSLSKSARHRELIQLIRKQAEIFHKPACTI